MGNFTLNATDAIIIVTGYLIGCFNAGYYLVRMRGGCDIRDLGSGTAGSRNVLRILGTRTAAAVLLADTAKGSAAAFLALRFGNGDWVLPASLLAVVAGHIWPIQLRFRGGKGLATAMGAVIILDFRIALIAGFVGMIAMILSRKIIVGGMFPVAVSPAIAAALGSGWERLVGISATGLVVLLAHRSNLREALAMPLRRGGGRR